jgi:hypothetical protein
LEGEVDILSESVLVEVVGTTEDNGVVVRVLGMDFFV